MLEDEADKLAREASPDPELRERMEIRGRVSFARYLNVNARGGLPDGAEGELNAACKVPGAAIPFDVWEPTLEQRQREQRALTPAPATGTGVTVQPILPAIFDPSKSGYVLPVPDLGDRGQGEGDDGESDPLTTLPRDLASAEGRTMLAPSMSGGFGAGPGTAPAPASEYVPRRFGASPPTALTELRRDIERSILASYGILPSLVDPKASGTALREARRQYHAGTVVPLATLVEAALSEALNETVSLNMRRGKATGSATLARAISSLTSSGMDLESAIIAVGL